MKLDENAPGDFFVDSNCLSCAACWKHAPGHFRSHDVEAYAYVYNQPKTKEEKDLCFKALAICPVQAINFQNKSLKCD